MNLCQIMQHDFLYGWGGYGPGYGDEDLSYGADYAASLLAEGIVAEPLDGYDLATFERWCRDRLRQGGQA